MITLKDSNWLSDQIINMYCNLIANRARNKLKVW